MNKTNLRVKGFTLGLPLKQRRKVTQKSPIQVTCSSSRQFSDVSFHTALGEFVFYTKNQPQACRSGT